MFSQKRFIPFIAGFALFTYTLPGYSQEVINQSGVQITSSQIRCTSTKNGTDNSYISLSLENTTDKQVTVSFYKQLWYNNNCINCNETSEEYLVQQTLSPYEKMEGNCTKENMQLLIFHSMPKHLSKNTLTKHKLIDIQVK